jgi:hypothetical protein
MRNNKVLPKILGLHRADGLKHVPKILGCLGLCRLLEPFLVRDALVLCRNVSKTPNQTKATDAVSLEVSLETYRKTS